MNLKFDTNNNIEPFTLLLTHKNHKVYGVINNTTDFIFKNEMQPYKEISFTVHETILTSKGKIKCNVWNSLKDFRYVYIPEIDEYFDIQVKFRDSKKKEKEVIGVLASAKELNGVLRNIEINTEEDISRDDYVEPTKFFNPYKKECSLLHRIFEKAKHYTIIHVDESLWDIQRSFSIDGESIYDFCIGKLQEEIGCLFEFNSSKRTVSVYDIFNTCNECEYRGEFVDTCTECGSKNIRNGYGKDTTIFISKDNLVESIELETNYSEIRNYLKVEGGDDLINATVMNCNPNGTAYIWEFSPETLEDMSDELSDKLEGYAKLCEEYDKEYTEIMSELYDAIDEELYLTSGMMPKFNLEETNANEQLTLLNTSSLSPVAVSNINSLSLTISNNAVLGMAKAVVDARFKVEIESSSLSSNRWTGKFKITNISDENDIAISSSNVSVLINDDYETFLVQKIKKMVNKEDSAELSNLLDITDYNTFTEELKKYCLNRLDSFYNAYQSVVDVLIEQGVANPSNYGDIYNSLYLPYHQKLNAISQEINVRESEIKIVQDNINDLENKRNDIQKTLDFNTYIGQDLLSEFYSFLIEDTYKNDNYISDGLDNANLFKMAQELLKVAKKELHKNVNNKYSITTNLNNLLKIKEFRPLLSYFECGNYIRIEVDDVIYKLRLLNYEIDFSEDTSDINVTFSDISKINDLSAETKSILSQAKSMSDSFSYVTRQANKGSEAKSTIDEMRYKGLIASNTMVKNADTEDVIFGNTGILCRSYDEITGGFGLTQLKIIHNSLNITDDGWITSKLAIGENIINGEKYFGMFADFVNAGKIWGTEIIGGTITGATFNNGNGTFSVDENGKLTAKDATISGTINGSAFVGGYIYLYNPNTGLSAEINPLEENFNGHNSKYIFNIQQEGNIILGVSKDGNGYFSGQIEADSGHIGNFQIIDGMLECKSVSSSENTWLDIEKEYTINSWKYNYHISINDKYFSATHYFTTDSGSLKTYDINGTTISYTDLYEQTIVRPNEIYYMGSYSSNYNGLENTTISKISFKPSMSSDDGLISTISLIADRTYVYSENGKSTYLNIGNNSKITYVKIGGMNFPGYGWLTVGRIDASSIHSSYIKADTLCVETTNNSSGEYDVAEELDNLNSEINSLSSTVDSIGTSVDDLSSTIDSFESGSVIMYEAYTQYGVTVSGKTNKAVNMGSFSVPSGYTFLGICSGQNGFGDQWQVTYGIHGNYIYAMIYNYYETPLTNDISCRAIFMKN